MTVINGLMLFLSILLFYFVIVYILHKKSVLKKYKISLYGPALLLRTKKGIGFLKKIASKKRFWKAFGSSGIFLCFVVMILMTILLIWNTWFIFALDLTPAQKEALPGPEVVLPLPGINPILPLEYIVYIFVALLIAMIVHEFSHGILTFASKLKVKSLGLLYIIVPVGAFCEPYEEQLRKTKASTRMRVYAAGPTSNFVVFFVSLLIFSFIFMSAVHPVDGVDIFYIGENTPAEEIGLSSGVVIMDINGTKITGLSDFYYALENTSANQTISISYFRRETIYTKNVTLADKYNYTENKSHAGKGYLGVGPNIYGGYLSVLKNPFNYYSEGFLLLYALPLFGYLQGYNPIASPFTDSYTITGPLGSIPTDIFWAITSMLYWILWLNLAVGLFNVLPMVPLDGGFLFNDAIGSLIKRFKKNLSGEKREKIVKNISLIVSLTILFLVIFPFFIKYF
ncbi:MAG: site-2 protease family protein [Thermoplasmatales archaeon]|nr:MAG: site-2 protease family protein [Thermoplasmatales archaeon]